MADDMQQLQLQQQLQQQQQQHVPCVSGISVDGGAHAVEALEQHGMHAAAAAAVGEYAVTAEVSEDILQQALAVNSFYLQASSGTPAADESSAVAVPPELYTTAASGGSGLHVAATVDGGSGVALLAEGERLEEATEAPLGSRGNPIRLMQHGNQFTSAQHLLPDQLAQIMQVLQHQHQIARCPGGTTVLLQGDGSDKFVYRVVYPGDGKASAGTGRAASNGVTAPGARAAASRAQQMQHQRSSSARKYRGKKRKRASDEWEEASDGEWVAPESGGSDDSRAPGTEMTREEKEQRKKQRPRTRSGRVSKPPKHMVKDYKHIHPLDWDEDYDDSDGGYSDFKHSGDEGGDSKDSMDTSVYSDARKKVWRCRTCGKAYIGTGGLGRHYRLYPEHGSLSDLTGPTGLLPDGTPVQLFQQSGPSNHNDLSQDSLSRDTAMSNDGLLPGLSGDVAPHHVSPHFATGSLSSLDSVTPSRYLQQTAQKKIIKTPGYVPTGRPRGRPPSNPAELAERRRHRLRDLVQQCNHEDLIEIVLPMLLPTVSSWEFLLMRCEEASRTSAAAEEHERRAATAEGRPHSACSSGGSLILREVLREFECVRNRAAEAVKACIQQQQLLQQQRVGGHNGIDGSQLSPDAPGMSGSVTLRIEDEAMAKALDLEVGYYDAVGELLEQSRLRQPPTTAATATPAVASGSAFASEAAVSGSVNICAVATATTSSSSIQSGTSLLRDRSLLPSASSSIAAQALRTSTIAGTQQQQQQHPSSAAATATEAALRHLSQKQSSQVSHELHQTQQRLQQQQPPSAHSQQQQQLEAQEQAIASVTSQRQRRLPSPTSSSSAQQLLAMAGHHPDLSAGEQPLQTVYASSGDVLTLPSSGADDTVTIAEPAEGYDDGAAAAAGMDQPMYAVTANGELITADGSLVQLPEGASLIQTPEGLVIYQQPTDAVAAGAALQFEGGQAVPLESLPQGLMLAVEADGTLRYVGSDQASRM